MRDERFDGGLMPKRALFAFLSSKGVAMHFVELPPKPMFFEPIAITQQRLFDGSSKYYMTRAHREYALMDEWTYVEREVTG
jgi:hypothetical protein